MMENEVDDGEGEQEDDGRQMRKEICDVISLFQNGSSETRVWNSLREWR